MWTSFFSLEYKHSSTVWPVLLSLTLFLAYVLINWSKPYEPEIILLPDAHSKQMFNINIK